MKRPSRGLRPLAWLGLAAAAALAGSCSSVDAATVSPSKSPARLTVTSTLDGHAVLPSRIHWQAFSSAGRAHLQGRLPDRRLARLGGDQFALVYGRDGNWLVTHSSDPASTRSPCG